MASSEDTEITLGTGKLLVLFFGLVGICALFFALGYSLGKKSEPAIPATSAAVTPQGTPGAKASSGSTPAATPPPMTFYKSVEQKDASPELTPAADSKTETSAAPATTAANPAGSAGAASNGAVATPASAADPALALPTASYFVQVAAVSKQDDADALVDALKKKQYPALVAAQVPTDKLFRVQVGPFSDIKDAEAMRVRLMADGYSPIVKK